MGKSYRDLVAWQKAIQFVADIYSATRNFPKEEMQGLTAQIRNNAVGIASSIAEGQASMCPSRFREGLQDSLASLIEVDTQLTVAAMLNYLKGPDMDGLMGQVADLKKILTGLLSYLEGPAGSESALRMERMTAIAARAK